MVKKFKNDEIFIKGLLDSGSKPAEILKKYKKKFKHLNLTFQKLNYWKKTNFDKPIIRRKKLDEKYIKQIVDWAKNKTTSISSSRKIALEINKKLENEGKNITISKSTICSYLNNSLGKPRKIRKTFALNEKNKQRRVEHCENLIKNNKFKVIK